MLLANEYRQEIFGLDLPVRVFTAIALLILGWRLARDIGRLGLLYSTFARGEDSIMVPNNIVLASAVVPLREPSSVDLRARLRPDVLPSEVQELLDEGIRTPVRSEPHIGVEEIDSDEVVVRIAATPAAESDGQRLADEILEAIAPITREGLTEEREAARARGEDGRRGDHGRRDDHGSRPKADPPGHVTQEYES